MIPFLEGDFSSAVHKTEISAEVFIYSVDELLQRDEPKRSQLVYVLFDRLLLADHPIYLLGQSLNVRLHFFIVSKNLTQKSVIIFF